MSVMYLCDRVYDAVLLCYLSVCMKCLRCIQAGLNAHSIIIIKSTTNTNRDMYDEDVYDRLRDT